MNSVDSHNFLTGSSRPKKNSSVFNLMLWVYVIVFPIITALASPHKETTILCFFYVLIMTRILSLYRPAEGSNILGNENSFFNELGLAALVFFGPLVVYYSAL